jgi:hypothetical protein
MRTEENYRDGFEQMLKETADRFSMQPSRHIWHSLYNNIHPSRKWPSAGAWLLFLSCLFLLDPSGKMLPAGSSAKPLLFAEASLNDRIINSENSTGNVVLTRVSAKNAVRESSPASSDAGPYFDAKNSFSKVSEASEQKDMNATETAHAPATEDHDEYLLREALRNIATRYKAGKLALNRNIYQPFITNTASSEINKQKNKRSNSPDQISEIEKISSPGKFGFAFYATPSIGFRGFSRNGFMETNQYMDELPGDEGENESPSIRIPAFNMEAGGTISYDLSDIMRFKAGLQLNYTRYNIDAGSTDQSAAGGILQDDPGQSAALFYTRSSDFAAGSVYERKIMSNQSYQVSLPLGADVKLADAENFEWFAGASVQPTLILPGNAGMLAEENKNLNSDVAMIRNWNINGGIETFISYDAGRGIRLNAGPQLRYQILSSYKNQYTINERLYNIGIKLGVSSRF